MLGVCGPICSSANGLSGTYPDTFIQYSVDAVVDTPVFCKLLGVACYAYEVTCYFALHPRTNVGYRVLDCPNTIIWCAFAARPQIQCCSSAILTALV